MTYCVAIRVNDGLVFASDTRTSAGVDDIRTYSKMHVPEFPGERSPGNSDTCILLYVLMRSEEHTSELQSRSDLVCRLLLEKQHKGGCSRWRHGPSAFPI